MKRTWTPTAEDWARYGARPMTREEVAAEKRAIEEARRLHAKRTKHRPAS